VFLPSITPDEVGGLLLAMTHVFLFPDGRSEGELAELLLPQVLDQLPVIDLRYLFHIPADVTIGMSRKADKVRLTR